MLVRRLSLFFPEEAETLVPHFVLCCPGLSWVQPWLPWFWLFPVPALSSKSSSLLKLDHVTLLQGQVQIPKIWKQGSSLLGFASSSHCSFVFPPLSMLQSPVRCPLRHP